jgi:hypothetical protein
MPAFSFRDIQAFPFPIGDFASAQSMGDKQQQNRIVTLPQRVAAIERFQEAPHLSPMISSEEYPLGGNWPALRLRDLDLKEARFNRTKK